MKNKWFTKNSSKSNYFKLKIEFYKIINYIILVEYFTNYIKSFINYL
jgi:hypothetical protein